MTTRPTKSDIDDCRRCMLWQRATQGVAGEGLRSARLMLVGEQPGDAEDRTGKPFVGPAGEVLRHALEEAGIAKADVYITNAVKHFNWEPRGIRRIHKTPLQREIAACHDWLEAEVSAMRPVCIVTLGATALYALTGRRLAVSAGRAAELAHASGATLIATYHPSALLHAIAPSQRERLYRILVGDLRRALAVAQELVADPGQR